MLFSDKDFNYDIQKNQQQKAKLNFWDHLIENESGGYDLLKLLDYDFTNFNKEWEKNLVSVVLSDLEKDDLVVVNQENDLKQIMNYLQKFCELVYPNLVNDYSNFFTVLDKLSNLKPIVFKTLNLLDQNHHINWVATSFAQKLIDGQKISDNLAIKIAIIESDLNNNLKLAYIDLCPKDERIYLRSHL